MFDQIMIQFLNGLSYAMILVLVGFGMAIIFGLMDVVNMAHGEFFVLGCYTAWIVTMTTGNFWASIIVAPLVVGLLGMGIERTLIRRFYKVPLVTLLLTWGISIMIRQLIRLIAGPDWKRVLNPIPGATQILGVPYPSYRLFIIILAIAVMAIIGYLILKTDFGLRVRSVIQNREQASAMGIRTDRLDTTVFGIGTALAGLAGAVMAPLLTVQPEAGLPFLADSFMVVIVGGIGRILGVVAGGLTLGLGYSAISFFADPIWSRVAIFVFAIIMIRIRPQGLLGTVKRGSWMIAEIGKTGKSRRVLPSLFTRQIGPLPLAFFILLAIAVIIPFFTSEFQMGFLSKYYIFAMLGLSLGLMWGYAGILSFGQAALFGLGAYAMGLFTKNLAFPGEAYIGLLLAIIVPVIVAIIMGYLLFYGKVGGVFFGIVTLIMSLVFYQSTVSSIGITGGLNGLYPIPPLNFELPGGMQWVVNTATGMYYVAVLVLALLYLLTRHITRSSLGRLMKAVEGNEDRTEYFGYNLANTKIMIFAICAALAGLAGGLYATNIQFLSPDLMYLGLSTSVIVWVAVGGRGTLSGPIIGAVIVNVLELFLSGALVDIWALLVGLFLVLIVLFRPKGIMGYIVEPETPVATPVGAAASK